MQILVVVNNPADWPLSIPGVQLVSAKTYLTNPEFSELRNVKVFNLCRRYQYQSTGWYVSLLASARGHRPIPSIPTIQDLKSQTIIRFVSDDLAELIQKTLTGNNSESFTLSIYFGRNVAKKYDRLASALFNMFHVPFIRAQFRKTEEGWELSRIFPIPAGEIPTEHYPFVIQVAEDYFSGRRPSIPKKQIFRYDLGILYENKEADTPSNEKAIQKFVDAAEDLGLSVELITKDDYARLAEFDALFIRETTSINHYTYRFSRRAAAEGLIVIDDPMSILRCTNKVYLAELMTRHEITIPETVIVHKDNVDIISQKIKYPIVLKKPDSAFSIGVIKCHDKHELSDAIDIFLEKSDLLVAQEFVPTEFDWRVGIMNKKVLFVCKYFMAKKHWQIIRRDKKGNNHYGNFENIPVHLAPKDVISIALKAANLIGDGLYGVDLKQVGKKIYVIEVNDNPSIDFGVEDEVLGDELYERIIGNFIQRLDKRTEKLK